MVMMFSANLVEIGLSGQGTFLLDNDNLETLQFHEAQCQSMGTEERNTTCTAPAYI